MLYDHVIPVIGNGVVVDLPTLFREIDTLEARGVSCADLKVSSRAHLIFPWHQAHDAIAEAMRGDDKIGTTLKGIGPAYADKARRVGVRVGEVADLDAFAGTVRARAIAENDADRAGGCRAARRRRDRRPASPEYGERLQPYVVDTVTLLHEAVASGAHVLLEGAQATFLDLDHGTYPVRHVVEPDRRRGVRREPGSVRATSTVSSASRRRTRHAVGAGPFPTELLDADGDTLIDVGHEFGTVTGRRRRAGWLDCVMLRHAVRLNSLTELALTKLDVLDGFEAVKVCVGYRLDGAPARRLPRSIRRARPGRAGVRDAVRLAHRPVGDSRAGRICRARRASSWRWSRRQVGVPVKVVGVGAERDDYLLWTA